MIQRALILATFLLTAGTAFAAAYTTTYLDVVDRRTTSPHVRLASLDTPLIWYATLQSKRDQAKDQNACVTDVIGALESLGTEGNSLKYWVGNRFPRPGYGQPWQYIVEEAILHGAKPVEDNTAYSHFQGIQRLKQKGPNSEHYIAMTGAGLFRDVYYYPEPFVTVGGSLIRPGGDDPSHLFIAKIQSQSTLELPMGSNISASTNWLPPAGDALVYKEDLYPGRIYDPYLGFIYVNHAGGIDSIGDYLVLGTRIDRIPPYDTPPRYRSAESIYDPDWITGEITYPVDPADDSTWPEFESRLTVYGQLYQGPSHLNPYSGYDYFDPNDPRIWVGSKFIVGPKREYYGGTVLFYNMADPENPRRELEIVRELRPDWYGDTSILGDCLREGRQCDRTRFINSVSQRAPESLGIAINKFNDGRYFMLVARSSQELDVYVSGPGRLSDVLLEKSFRYRTTIDGTQGSSTRDVEPTPISVDSNWDNYQSFSLVKECDNGSDPYGTFYLLAFDTQGRDADGPNDNDDDLQKMYGWNELHVYKIDFLSRLDTQCKVGVDIEYKYQECDGERSLNVKWSSSPNPEHIVYLTPRLTKVLVKLFHCGEPAGNATSDYAASKVSQRNCNFNSAAGAYVSDGGRLMLYSSASWRGALHFDFDNGSFGFGGDSELYGEDFIRLKEFYPENIYGCGTVGEWTVCNPRPTVQP
jgi:hypothetical protein